MGKLKRKIFGCSIIAGLTAILSVTASLAWIFKTDSINTDGEDGIQGSLLTSYFDGGDGTESNPFIIDRPLHWENLIWLHNNVPYFYNANIAIQYLVVALLFLYSKVRFVWKSKK